MSTTIRPEISQKKNYWIERHRYYELKHFCLQYPIWRKACAGLDGLAKHNIAAQRSSGEISDPTGKAAEAREWYIDRMKLVEKTANNTDSIIAPYILKGVTEGRSYDYLRLQHNIPCGKDMYYNLYRRFFWLLSKERQ